MTKGEYVTFYKRDHDKLRSVVGYLSKEDVTTVKIIGDWTVKDILAHIAAWNWEEIKAIDLLLRDEKPWYVGKSEGTFNKKAVKMRKRKSLHEVYQEWEESFERLIARISLLSQEEWLHSTALIWEDGTPLTVASLFSYTYEGAGHEGGHAKQIRRKLKSKD